jgi:hypothetical protein
MTSTFWATGHDPLQTYDRDNVPVVTRRFFAPDKGTRDICLKT